MGEKGLKSAYELAIEKLKARDREKGLEKEKALSQDQKRRIGEIRTQARAKLAEIEILWKSERARLWEDPETLEKAEREYVAERKRVEERSEAEVEKVRRGK